MIAWETFPFFRMETILCMRRMLRKTKTLRAIPAKTRAGNQNLYGTIARYRLTPGTQARNASQERSSSSWPIEHEIQEAQLPDLVTKFTYRIVACIVLTSIPCCTGGVVD